MGCQQSKQTNEDIISVDSANSSVFSITPTQLVCQDRGPIFDLYHFSTMISRSNYSIVRKAVNRMSKQQRVCKIIPLANKKYMTVISEVEYLKKVNHPNIVQIIEYFIEPSLIYIILQDIPGNKLLNSLVGQSFSFKVLQEIFLQLLTAVKYMHSRLICHRAITVDNIVVYWVKDVPYLKLLDFSQAAPLDCPNPSLVLISKRDIPLDCVDGKKLQKIDIFDCGMILWSMITGTKIKLSWLENMKQNIDKSLTILQLSSEVKTDLKDLLSSMLNSNPSKRPSIVQCINHAFFRHFHNSPDPSSLKKLIAYPKTPIIQNQLFQFLRMYASLTMSSPLDKAQLMTEFNNLDTNKDGQIQFDELVIGIQNTYNFDKSISTAHALDIFKKLDKNNNGTLDFSEYVLGTINLTKLISQDFLDKMFKELDHNNDGQIEEQELLDMIGDSVLVSSKLIGKGTISFNKFIQIMNQVVKQTAGGDRKTAISSKSKNKVVSIKTLEIQQYDSQQQNKENARRQNGKQ